METYDVINSSSNFVEDCLICSHDTLEVALLRDSADGPGDSSHRSG